MRPLDAVAQQLAAQQQRLAEQVLTVEPAVVVTVQASAATDGQALVSVRHRGAVIRVAYPVGLALAVGQTVQLLVPDRSPPFVLTRLVGTP